MTEDAPSTDCESCENVPGVLVVLFADDNSTIILCNDCCSVLTAALGAFPCIDLAIMPVTSSASWGTPTLF